jgi:hypothetical protein
MFLVLKTHRNWLHGDPLTRPVKMSSRAARWAGSARSSMCMTHVHGDPGSSSLYQITRTSPSEERSISPSDPSVMCHDKAPMHSPYVDRPPGFPSILRHGQIASQLQTSR